MRCDFGKRKRWTKVFTFTTCRSWLIGFTSSAGGFSDPQPPIKIISIKHPMLFYGVPGLLFFALGLIFTVITLSNFAETRNIITNQALLAIGSIVVGLVLIMTSIILTSIISVVRERRN